MIDYQCATFPCSSFFGFWISRGENDPTPLSPQRYRKHLSPLRVKTFRNFISPVHKIN